MRCRPWIWLWGLLPLVILWFAAIVAGVPKMERGLSQRAEMVLAVAGQDWAHIVLDGRDLMLSGAAPDETAHRRAREALSSLWGVRSVSDLTTVTAAPPPPAETSGDREPGNRAPGATDTRVTE